MQIILMAVVMALIFKRPPIEEEQHHHNKTIIPCSVIVLPHRSQRALPGAAAPKKLNFRSRATKRFPLPTTIAAERERRRVESHLKGNLRDVMLFALLLALILIITIIKNDTRTQNQNQTIKQLFTPISDVCKNSKL